jgi:hypothetical protein
LYVFVPPYPLFVFLSSIPEPCSLLEKLKAGSCMSPDSDYSFPETHIL